MAAAFGGIVSGVADVLALPALVCALLAAAMVLIRPGPRTASVALLAVTFCTSLTLADLALRKILAERLYYRPEDALSRRSAEATVGRYAADVRWEGETFGDLAAMSGDPALREPRAVRFETDRRGLRNTPGQLDEPNRVLLLGDSFVVGSGTSHPDIVPQRLIREAGIPSYAIGFPGSPEVALANLRLELPRITRADDVRLLWWLFAGNDLQDIGHDRFAPRPIAGALYGELWRLEGFRTRSPTRMLLRGHGPEREQRNAAMVVARHTPDGRPLLFFRPYLATLRPAQIRAHRGFARLRATFGGVAELARSEGLAVTAVVVPSKPQVYPRLADPNGRLAGTSAFASVVSELADRVGFEVLDLTPHFAREARRLLAEEGELLWWRDDTHWNPQGHALASRVLARHLEARLEPRASRP